MSLTLRIRVSFDMSGDITSPFQIPTTRPITELIQRTILTSVGWHAMAVQVALNMIVRKVTQTELRNQANLSGTFHTRNKTRPGGPSRLTREQLSDRQTRTFQTIGFTRHQQLYPQFPFIIHLYHHCHPYTHHHHTLLQGIHNHRILGREQR